MVIQESIFICLGECVYYRSGSELEFVLSLHTYLFVPTMTTEINLQVMLCGPEVFYLN